MFFPRSINNYTETRKSGFTLIEVLVATTILLVIVILVSMVFQGSNAAFQAGNRKIASQTLMRNIIGMISRDLTQAVDPEDYPGLESSVSIKTGQKISFLALTGTPGKNRPNSTGAGTHDERALQIITYEYSAGRMKRTVDEVTSSYGSDGAIWSKSGTSSSTYLNSESDPLNSFLFQVKFYNSKGKEYTPTGNSGGHWLPDCVEIMTSVNSTRKVSFAAARSAGKDKQFGTDDDIVVGGNPFGE